MSSSKTHNSSRDGLAAHAEIKQREAELEQHLGRGPPLRGTEAQPITWLFEPDSFALVGKVVGDRRFSIVTDHLGTPVQMLDESGDLVWSAETSIYGELRELHGNPHGCPFRWPGQYEDAETGLYFNRYRYYDPDAGEYLSQDPISLAGGMALHAYVQDPTSWVDILGLKKRGGIVLGQNMPDRVIPAARGMKNAGWLDVDPKKWSWEKNRKFLHYHINEVKKGKGKIYDIGGQRGRYQGPKAIYTREKPCSSATA